MCLQIVIQAFTCRRVKKIGLWNFVEECFCVKSDFKIFQLDKIKLDGRVTGVSRKNHDDNEKILKKNFVRHLLFSFLYGNFRR